MSTQEQNTEVLIDADEAARLLGLSSRSVKKLANDRLLRSVRISRKTLRFRPSAIREFIESRQSPATA